MEPNEEKDELDRYNIPAKSRPRVFYFGIAGLSTTASILLIKLLMCQSGTTEKVETILKAQIEDMKEREAAKAQEKMQRVINETAPPINEAKTGIDSLQKEIKTFKN